MFLLPIGKPLYSYFSAFLTFALVEFTICGWLCYFCGTDSTEHAWSLFPNRFPKTINPSSIHAPCLILFNPTLQDISWSRHGNKDDFSAVITPVFGNHYIMQIGAQKTLIIIMIKSCAAYLFVCFVESVIFRSLIYRILVFRWKEHLKEQNWF